MLGPPPARSDPEFLRRVENGLSVQSAQALANRLGTAAIGAGVMVDVMVSRRTLNRRRKGNQLVTRDAPDKLVRVTRIVALAEGVFPNPQNQPLEGESVSLLCFKI